MEVTAEPQAPQVSDAPAGSQPRDTDLDALLFGSQPEPDDPEAALFEPAPWPARGAAQIKAPIAAPQQTLAEQPQDRTTVPAVADPLAPLKAMSDEDASRCLSEFVGAENLSAVIPGRPLKRVHARFSTRDGWTRNR